MSRRLERAEKMEALGTLVGSVSHEFNNLLAIINGNVEILSLDPQTPDPVKSRQSIIQRAVFRGTSTIERLIRPATLEDSDSEPDKREWARVSAMLANLRELTATFLTSEIELLISIDEDLTLAAPQKELEMALINLIKNAAEAIVDKGRITIKARRTAGSEMLPELTIDKQVDFVEIQVCDSGPGVPEALQDRLFEPFFTTKSATSGTGLGLWLVYSTCRKYGGTVSYRSPSDNQEGAFLLYLPVGAGKQFGVAPILPAALQKNSLAGCRILVVEDEVDMLSLYTDYFSALGAVVSSALSIAEARS